MSNQKYHHGGDIFSLARKHKVEEDQIIDLSSNIVSKAPDCISHFLQENLATIHHLPEPHSQTLLEQLSGYYRVPHKFLVCGAGTTELIQGLCHLFASKTVLIVQPTYSDYERYATLYHCKIVHYILIEKDDFQFQIVAFCQKVSEAKVVFLCNPNNPTGTIIEKEVLVSLVQRFSKTMFVIDESYLPFVVSGESFSMLGELLPNLVVLRSFSKIYAIPGLRVGWLFSANQELVQGVKQFLSPWSVNSLAQSLAKQLIGLQVEEILADMREIKTHLVSKMADLTWLHFYPSQTNFVLVKSSRYSSDALYDYFSQHRILIRNCSNFLGLDSSFIRLSIKDQKSIEKAIRLFQQLDDETMKHLNIEVYGRVQGVGFRYHTHEQAQRWGIKGFVRNRLDGSVYIEAEGAESSLNDFVAWCHQGPAFASVRQVLAQEEQWQGYSIFEIRH